MLLDNEDGKDKPLRKINNKLKDKSKFEKLKENHYINLNENLYIWIVHKNKKIEKENWEIENLFLDTTTETTINEKKFEWKYPDLSKTDYIKTYSKNIFAKYVYKNYENIDFKNFIPFLDDLNEILIEAENKI
ncbi:hypothetical protein DMC14_001440 [Metamycoplasma phocicerebrale]|uniref:Uncharacterized protein n=1 Tax=Metamycoplasma phocicerebrale TaxID=142649 RepID=A0A3Q9VA64_9BACT|nr:hypothetical protein [Metamycoplasma phocicerebrale]AZZ65450.1 hypothetical protein DMC14_001440 [Metamycoplasma phocicerebrale]